MEKNVRLSMLLEIYKEMLTEKQSDIIDLYYNQNLSLSEIADYLNVSRQAVRKSLVEAEKNLLVLEEKLKILESRIKRQKKIYKIINLVDDEKIIKMIEDLID